MPTVHQCPNCQKKMRVPDGIGGSLRCPQCGAKVSLGQSATSPTGPAGANEPLPARPAAPTFSSQNDSHIRHAMPPDRAAIDFEGA
jgi:hypothetical protein